MTCGVIQPAHTLSRGKTARSMTTTSRPARRSARAEEDPAGPPPTIRTSQVSMSSLVSRPWSLVFGPWVFRNLRARPGDLVAPAAGEQHLEQLQRAGRERRL